MAKPTTTWAADPSVDPSTTWVRGVTTGGDPLDICHDPLFIAQDPLTLCGTSWSALSKPATSWTADP